MDRSKRQRPTLPLVVAIAPPFLFFALTSLANAPWHGTNNDSLSRAILSLSLALPLSVLSLADLPSWNRRWAELSIASAASVLLCLHAGLSSQIVTDLDSGSFPSAETIKAAAGVFLGAFAVPAGLLGGRRALLPPRPLHLCLERSH
jgi:hypothetical protein